MKTLKPIGKEVWILYYQWWDNYNTMSWGAYDSSEALFFNFEDAYRRIVHDSKDDISDEEIAWAKEKLKKESCVEIPDLGLYMNIEPMVIYGLEEQG